MSESVMENGRPVVIEPIPPRGPGSLVHRREGNGRGPSGCIRCGWRGMPTMTGGRRVGPLRRYFRFAPPGSAVVDSTVSDECPACEIGAETASLWARRRHLDAEPIRRGPRVGRNDPCPCSSGRKFKKCCGATA